MSKTDAYVTLMDKAATGDHQAAWQLLAGEWYPGDPDSVNARERVIGYARWLAEQARKASMARHPAGRAPSTVGTVEEYQRALIGTHLWIGPQQGGEIVVSESMAMDLARRLVEATPATTRDVGAFSLGAFMDANGGNRG